MSSPASRFCNWLEQSKPFYIDNHGRDMVYQGHELVTTGTRSNVQKAAVEFKTHISTVGEIRRAARFLVAKMAEDSGLHVTLNQAHSRDDGRLVVFANVRNTKSQVFQRSSDDSTHELSEELRTKPAKNSPGIAVPIDPTSEKYLIWKTKDSRISGVKITLQEAYSRDEGRLVAFVNIHDASHPALQQPGEDDKTNELLEEPRTKPAKNDPGTIVPIHPVSEEYLIWKTASATRKATFNGSEVMLPVMVRSQGVSTDIVTSQPSQAERPQRCEIPLNYESPEFADKIVMSYLTNTNVYERARLQLAYFRYERNASINLMSYVNNKVFLASNGLPQDDSELERIYYKFCAEKGIAKEEVVKDMEATRREMDNKLLTQKSVARKNFNEYYTPNSYGSHGTGSAGCDPEICNVM